MHKVGFIGLGNMGKGMASNLANNNVPLTCYDIDNSVFSELKNCYEIIKKNPPLKISQIKNII